MRTLLLLALFLCVISCEDNKETEIVQEYITVDVSMSKFYSQVSDFGSSVTSKGCAFPETISPNDLTSYYLTFESIDTGDVQVIFMADLNGSFELKKYGQKYNLTVSSYDNIVLPERSNQFHWYKNQLVDFDVSTQLSVVLENPYSAVVVVNNDSSIIGTPTLGGEDMYVNADGWEIFTKVVGKEELVITKADNTLVSYIEAFEPYIIYTYMYCDPLTFSISRYSAPFTTNKQTIFN